MSRTKSLGVELDTEDLAQLAKEAERQGMSPRRRAEEYVRIGLAGNGDAEMEGGRRAALEALTRLAELTADLPPADAVKISRESREELEGRPFL